MKTENIRKPYEARENENIFDALPADCKHGHFVQAILPEIALGYTYTSSWTRSRIPHVIKIENGVHLLPVKPIFAFRNESNSYHLEHEQRV